MATAQHTMITLKLTREEAIALCLLNAAGTGSGFVRRHLSAIDKALRLNDHKLKDEQYTKWKELGEPSYDLGE